MKPEEIIERWQKALNNSLLILLGFRAVFRAASATTVQLPRMSGKLTLLPRSFRENKLVMNKSLLKSSITLICSKDLTSLEDCITTYLQKTSSLSQGRELNENWQYHTDNLTILSIAMDELNDTGKANLAYHKSV